MSVTEHPPSGGRVARWGLAALVVLLAAGSCGGTATAAQSVDVRRAEVVAPSGRPIDGGGSATPFTLRLPDGAACPGDSANDGYRVNSYMVPLDVDPTTVTYDGTGPVPATLGINGSFRQPLYDLVTHPFVSHQTAEAAAPGAPGPIVNVPAFSFGVFARGDVPSGRYHVGIACTRLNEIEVVWDAELQVTEDAGDEPASLRWTTVGSTSNEDTGPSSALAVGAAAAVGAVVLIGRARRRRPPRPAVPTTQEER